MHDGVCKLLINSALKVMKAHCVHAGTGLYTGASGYFQQHRESVSVISESTPQTPSLNAYVALLHSSCYSVALMWHSCFANARNQCQALAWSARQNAEFLVCTASCTADGFQLAVAFLQSIQKQHSSSIIVNKSWFIFLQTACMLACRVTISIQYGERPLTT